MGNQRSTARLTVEEPTLTFLRKLPEFTILPIDATAELTIELSRPDVDVQWLKQGVKIQESEKYKIIVENNVRKLIIRNVTLEDQLEYTCVAETIRTSTVLKVGGMKKTLGFQYLSINCIFVRLLTYCSVSKCL